MPRVCLRALVVVAPVHVGQLAEAGAPVAEVVVVLVAAADGRMQRGEGAGRRATALVVEHQQGVIGRCRGVAVRRSQALQGEGERARERLSE